MMKVTPAFKFERAPEWWEEEVNTAPCIMLKRDGSCMSLNVIKCPGALQCNFFKSERDADASKVEWRRRLNSLSDSKQEDIAEKYYKNKRVWRGRKMYD